MNNNIDFKYDKSSITTIDYENDNINLSNKCNVKNDYNNIYYYPNNNLHTNIEDIYILNIDINTIDICIYQIINNTCKPFLLFYLINYNNTLVWPNIYHFNNNNLINFNNNNLINLNNINNINKTNFIQNFINYINNIFNNLYYDIKFNGLYLNTNENKYMIWFKLEIIENLNNYKHVLDTILNKHNWISIYEIINTKKYFKFLIHDSISTFFLSNNNFSYLKYYNNIYKKYLPISIPIIVYSCNSIYINNIIKTYGIFKESNKSSFGSYYYFYNYDVCEKKCLFRKNKNYSILRYIIFLNNYKCLINNDIFDPSLLDNYDSIIYKHNNSLYNNYIITNNLNNSNYSNKTNNINNNTNNLLHIKYIVKNVNNIHLLNERKYLTK